jgi:hypothetical protein
LRRLSNRLTGRSDVGLIRGCDGIARAGRLLTPQLFDWACTRILWTRIIVHFSKLLFVLSHSPASTASHSRGAERSTFSADSRAGAGTMTL